MTVAVIPLPLLLYINIIVCARTHKTAPCGWSPVFIDALEPF